MTKSNKESTTSTKASWAKQAAKAFTNTTQRRKFACEPNRNDRE